MSGSQLPGLEIRGEVDGRAQRLWLKGELDLVSSGLLETRIAELCTDGA